MLQGLLDLLVLKALSGGPRHGYAIAAHIHEVSEDLLRLEEGSLYPALHRLEKEKLVSAEWGESATGRRIRLYRLTLKGQKKLDSETDNWQRTVRGVAKVLKFA